MGMLILTRHAGEKITVELADDRTIEITCVDIRGDKVRIGIDCPRDLRVHRNEVWHQIDSKAPRRHNWVKAQGQFGEQFGFKCSLCGAWVTQPHQDTECPRRKPEA